MRRHYQYLNLDFLPLNDMDALPVYARISLIPKDNINQDLIDYLGEHALEIDHAAIFYARPGFNEGIIHVDGEKFDLEGEWPSRCKLNYVVGDTSTTTSWYDVSLEHRIKTKYAQTAIQSKFYAFDQSICTEIERVALGPWHLFESGIPHTIVNSSNKPRWCISYSLRKVEHPGWVTFSEVFKRLMSPSFNG